VRNDLRELVETLRAYPGVSRKRAIGEVMRALEGVTDFGRTLRGPGDDAAVLQASGKGFLLLATDGILPSLVAHAPREAGRAGVLVNANDIYAMGGRPIAMVNTLAGLSGRPLQEVLSGIREECLRLRIPMVGGHLIAEEGSTCLVVSVLGEAKALLLGSGARPGQALVLAVDLDGRRWGDFILNWDSHYRKTSEKLSGDLEVMVGLAEDGICSAARDVSMCGILGTIAVLLEASGVGGEVDLDAIEVPQGISAEDWYRVYPSYGFVLAAEKRYAAECLARFRDRGIWAGEIGQVGNGTKLAVRSRGETEVLYDFSTDSILDQRR
jgi:selenophosphate synthetase-related protein